MDISVNTYRLKKIKDELVVNVSIVGNMRAIPRADAFKCRVESGAVSESFFVARALPAGVPD